MDVYSANKPHLVKRLEHLFRYLFLVLSAIFASMCIFALILNGEMPKMFNSLAMFILVTWIASFGIWTVLLILNSRLHFWVKGLFNRVSGRKRKFGLVFLLIWLTLLTLFVLGAVFTQFASPWLVMLGTIIFWLLLILLPMWGLLLGNRLVKIITLAISILILFSSLVYFLIMRPHKISGNSMMPGFVSREYVLTEIVSYIFGNPKRGDVIVFTDPYDVSGRFIARVIGLPEEYISIKSGHVYINNKLLDEPYISADVTTTSGFFISSENVLIPHGEYVVLGDNRHNSNDSRHYGFVKRNDISGRVFYAYWPRDKAGFVKPAYLK